MFGGLGRWGRSLSRFLPARSPADCCFIASPGEFSFLSSFLFPRKQPFHCSSGGIQLPQLFPFPPQSAIPLLLRGNSASSVLSFSPANHRFLDSPGESGFLSSFLFPRNPPFRCFSGGIWLPQLGHFPPQTTVPLLLRGNLASSALSFSPANCYFLDSPGESDFLSSFLFPRRLLFPLLSGGIWLPRLGHFPPQTTVPLLLRGNLASSTRSLSPAIRHSTALRGNLTSSPIPHSTANRHSTASPGESGFLSSFLFPRNPPFHCFSGEKYRRHLFTAAPAHRAVTFYAHRALNEPSLLADGVAGGLCNATSEFQSRKASPGAHRKSDGDNITATT